MAAAVFFFERAGCFFFAPQFPRARAPGPSPHHGYRVRTRVSTRAHGENRPTKRRLPTRRRSLTRICAAAAGSGGAPSCCIALLPLSKKLQQNARQPRRPRRPAGPWRPPGEPGSAWEKRGGLLLTQASKGERICAERLTARAHVVILRTLAPLLFFTPPLSPKKEVETRTVFPSPPPHARAADRPRISEHEAQKSGSLPPHPPNTPSLFL